MTGRPYSQEMMELSEKWMNGTITPEERQRLLEWYDQFDDGELVLDPEQSRVFQQMKERLPEDIRRAMEPRGRVRKISFRRVAVAAALFAVVASAGYFALRPTRTVVPAATVTRRSPAPKDILPGGDRAVLELGDGSKVVLDSAAAGSIGRQGGADVVKNGAGGLKYNAQGSPSAVVYNRLTTPRGGQYRLELQDGTKVWLNAGSSIRYPTAFTGDERRVEISGEAYFEVAPNAHRPFRVAVTGETGAKAAGETGGDAAGEQEIEVLGTEFNVNAYADEPEARTTLVNGGVRVSSGGEAVVLRPLEQAVVMRGKGAGARVTLKKLEGDDLKQVVAWRNGAFGFDDADVATILRQIARWYDVQVVYEGRMPADRFTGRFSRSTSLEGVMRILNISGVHLEAENKTIVVKG